MATQLRNEVIFSDVQPSDDGRENGDLWVNALTLTMYAWDDNPKDESDPASDPIGWVGITSSQNQGSIVYVGDEQPTLVDVYPNLVGLTLLVFLQRYVPYTTLSSILSIVISLPSGVSIISPTFIVIFSSFLYMHPMTP